MTFTVAEIADALGTTQETVRRWIRSGTLTAERDSLKEGNKVSDESLKEFAEKHPKYASAVAQLLKLGRDRQIAIGKSALAVSMETIATLTLGGLSSWLVEAKATLAQQEQEVAELKRRIAVVERLQEVMNSTTTKGDQGNNGKEDF